MRDGIIFLEAPNGVILCDGNNSDGVLPLKYFTSVIDSKDGVNLLDDCRWSLTEWLRAEEPILIELSDGTESVGYREEELEGEEVPIRHRRRLDCCEAHEVALCAKDRLDEASVAAALT